MNMKQAIEAPRRSLFMMDPDSVVIIGRDTDDRHDHPRYDTRAHHDFQENIVIGMIKHGVKVPISVVKATLRDGTERLEVVDGRQRVINAREANRRLKEMGQPLLRIGVLPPENGSDSKMTALMALLNVHRTPMTPSSYGQMAQGLYDRGYVDEEVALYLNVTIPTVKRYMSLLTLRPEIQKLIAEGAVPAGKGYELAEKGELAQKAFLDRRENGSRSGEHKTKAPSKKVLRKLATTNTNKVSKDFLQGVRFALGLVKVQDVKGLQDLLGEKPEPEPVVETETTTRIVPVPPDAPPVHVKMTMVNGKMMPVKVLPPAPGPEEEPIAVKHYGTLKALNES